MHPGIYLPLTAIMVTMEHTGGNFQAEGEIGKCFDFKLYLSQHIHFLKVGHFQRKHYSDISNKRNPSVKIHTVNTSLVNFSDVPM